MTMPLETVTLMQKKIEKISLHLSLSTIKEEGLTLQKHTQNQKNYMLSIKNKEPWAFWPTRICSGFVPLAGNQLISGKYNFEFQRCYK